MSSAEPLTTSSPIDSRLEAMIARGYRFIHQHDQDGRLVTVVGVRPHHTVVDVVHINGEDDVVATRLPGEEPDIFEPGIVLWRHAGDARNVLDELLALPDTTEAASGQPLRGCWVPSEGGRAMWMAATG